MQAHTLLTSRRDSSAQHNTHTYTHVHTQVPLSTSPTQQQHNPPSAVVAGVTTNSIMDDAHTVWCLVQAKPHTTGPAGLCRQPLSLHGLPDGKIVRNLVALLYHPLFTTEDA